VNAQATAAIGDYVTLRHDGVDTWYITSQGGTWTRET
jgi:hypothetical protein